MRKGMTETIYTTGERHPQATKLFNGRPLTKGNYATRVELEEVVLDRYSRGYGYRRISRIVGVSDVTVATIIKQWKEKRDGTKDN
jgi:transposase-like protein